MIDVKHDDITLRTFILFVQSARDVMKYAESIFYRKTRLSVIKFIALQLLAMNGGTMKPSELARWTSTERHNITMLVDRMKRDGLVRTERNQRDKRLVHVSLTDKGLEALTQAMPVAREIVDQVMSSITEGEAVLFEKLLRVLRQNAHCSLEHVANCS